MSLRMIRPLACRLWDGASNQTMEIRPTNGASNTLSGTYLFVYPPTADVFLFNATEYPIKFGTATAPTEAPIEGGVSDDDDRTMMNEALDLVWADGVGISYIGMSLRNNKYRPLTLRLETFRHRTSLSRGQPQMILMSSYWEYLWMMELLRM